MSFVNLHAHSHYSLLDGFGTPKDIVMRSKELGYNACALTDHGVVYGLVEFYKAAMDAGIKPILGCEVYVAPRTRHDKEANVDNRPYHLTLLVENDAGYRNLLKLTTLAHLEGFYYKPRVDYDLLREYSDGLIALSGCLAGHLPRTILSGNDDDIEGVLRNYLDIFGAGHFFLEIQDHPLINDQRIVNERLRALGEKFSLGLVATNDSHYPRAEDREIHDLLLCIQTQTTIHDENRFRYNDDFSIRPLEDLKIAFKDFPGALENTVKIADMCDVNFDFGTNLIPSFDTPNNQAAHDYLRVLCEEGLRKRFRKASVPQGYTERLDYELSTVHNMGFDTYFLIVSDFVRYAKSKGIFVGPGRGSAAGSIIAWSLDITDVDPIHYGLFFERFLNPERISMPDIDIDFADHRRDEVLEYVIEKYGRNNVAQILTFGTMAPRAAVRDVGRAMGYPYPEVDAISKTIPAPILGKTAPLVESIEDDRDLSKLYNSDARARALLDYAKKLEGTVRHVGTHACAVVISEKPLTEYTALQFGASGGGEIVTQFSAKPLEDLGLLKMDFLGLRNLTIMESVQKIVKRTRAVEVDVTTIPLDDKKTFKLLKAGDTTGVFQLESSGMKRYLRDLKPTHFDDIVAMGALYRPGPMEWIPTYIKGKHNPNRVKYLHPSFKEVLQSTYGVAVFQEQILQLARDFAGFSLGEADILRKAVGKKDPVLLIEQREKFIEGAVSKGHPEAFAREVFEKVIEPFAGYGFNKAHAVCYGMIAYQTAYLKAHFPIEFMTALLCSDSGNTDRVVLEINECNEMGLKVLPPSINESFKNFTVVDKKCIRFGLTAIKGIGEGPIKAIIDARNDGGHFSSLDDFATRVPAHILNKKLIQALAFSGALDSFGDRSQIAENYDNISKYAKSLQEFSSSGQTAIFDVMDGDVSETCPLELRDVPSATSMQTLTWEKEFLGMYVSGHPLYGLRSYISKKADLIGNLNSKKVGKSVRGVGLITGLRKILTKKGAYMAMFCVEDSTARVSCVMFPRDFQQYSALLAEDALVSFTGKLDNKRGQYQIICDAVKVLSLDGMIENAKEAGSFDENEEIVVFVPMLDDVLASDDDGIAEVISDASTYLIEIPDSVGADKMSLLKALLLRNKGKTPVEIFVKSADKKIKLPFGIDLNQKLKDDIVKIFVDN